MERNKVEELLLMNASKLPPEGLQMIRERLLNMEDSTLAQIVLSQLKDPTLALILSIVIGYWGADRFYIGDMGIGLGKLLTCGGAWIWYVIDIFLIMDATKKKNLETLLIQLR
ncbi:MAG: TM2 domain-containing protein [Bacteroidaceae bacterium]|nr:TM2 domain-containing protein [Bacteroidaceae bacterium]